MHAPAAEPVTSGTVSRWMVDGRTKPSTACFLRASRCQYNESGAILCLKWRTLPSPFLPPLRLRSAQPAPNESYFAIPLVSAGCLARVYNDLSGS